MDMPHNHMASLLGCLIGHVSERQIAWGQKRSTNLYGLMIRAEMPFFRDRG